MRMIEITLIAILTLGILMSIHNIPLGSTLLLLSSGILVLFNVALAFLDKTAANTNKKILLFIIALVLAPVILGTLYIFMFWTFGRIMLYQSILVTAIAAGALAYKFSQIKTPYYRTLAIRTTGYFMWALALSLIPARALYDYKYSESPNYSAFIKAEKAYNADFGNKELKKEKDLQWDSVRNFMLYRNMQRREAEKQKRGRE